MDPRKNFRDILQAFVRLNEPNTRLLVKATPAVLWSPPPAIPSPEGMFWVLVSGLVATGCGMILRGMLIRRESALYTSTNGM